MSDIGLPGAPWSTDMLPMAILERWLVDKGARVSIGVALPTARIGEASHEIVSSPQGQVSIMAPAGARSMPAAYIAQVDARQGMPAPLSP